MEKETILYEIGYLLNPNIPGEKIDDEVVLLRKKIEEKGGFIITEGKPTERILSYPIKKHNNSYFGWIKFMMDPKQLFDFKKEIESSSFLEKINLLRFLIIKTKKETTSKTTSLGISKGISKRVPQKTKMKPEEKTELKDENLDKEIDKKIDELLEKEVAENQPLKLN